VTFVIVALSAILVLWIAAWFSVRRVAVSRLWIVVDGVLGGVVGIVVAVDGRVLDGALLAGAITPILILFSAFRTVQMRYIERKTQTILDTSPALRDAYDGPSPPSRAERRTARQKSGDGAADS
jgi:hypothetical protein